MFQETVNVGVAKSLALEDLAEIMPDVASSLQNILDYEGDVEQDMYMTFQVTLGQFSGHIDISLTLSPRDPDQCGGVWQNKDRGPEASRRRDSGNCD